MVYFKVVLNDKRPKADDIYPIEIRVTHNRQNTTVTTGVRIKKEYWDAATAVVKHNHPNSLAYNKTVVEASSKVQSISFKLVAEERFSFDELRKALNGTALPAKQSVDVCFKEFADDLVDSLLDNHHAGNAIVYRTATNRLLEYAHNPKLKFSEVNYTMLEGFRCQLVKDGVKQNTISNYFRTLRAIYNKGIKAKAVERSLYPFLDIPIKTERTAKRALSFNDLKVLHRADVKPGTPEWRAKNLFFISFSLIGASFTDLAYLRPTNVQNGRLNYKRRKTGKMLSIKLTPYTEQLLQHYDSCNTPYLLPILSSGIEEDSMRAKAVITQAIRVTNKYLNRLGVRCKAASEVTTYVARHSWATTAKRLGYSIELIAEALGHEYGNKITNIYLDAYDQDVIDEVNAKVIMSLQQ